MKSSRSKKKAPAALARRYRPAGELSSPPTDPLPTKLAASYARKSDANDHAVKGQHQVNRQRALEDGYRVPDEPAFLFEDDGISGRTVSRPGLQRLHDLVVSGKARFSRIYVRDLTRLTRHDDPRFLNHFTYEMKRHGVLLCDASREQSVIDYDISSSQDALGTFLADSVQAVTGSIELMKLKSRVRQGIRHALRLAYYPSGHAPFGTQRYVVDKNTGHFLAEVPSTGSLRLPNGAFKLRWAPNLLPWIKRIFDACEDGYSASAIAEMLNDAGVPTSGAGRTGSGKVPRWTTRSVNVILRNPIYTGTFKWGFRRHRNTDAPPLDQVKIDGTGPVLIKNFMSDAPISSAQWDRVQEVLRKRREKHSDSPRPGRPPFLLTGLLRCTSCKGWYHGMTKSTGRQRRYYRHGRQPLTFEGRCPHAHRVLNAEELEAQVVNLIRDLVRDDSLLVLVREHVAKLLCASHSSARAGELDQLRRDVVRLEAAAARAAANAATAEDAEHQHAYKSALQDVSNQLSQLKRRVSAVEVEEAHLRRMQDRAAEVAAKLRDRRALVDSAKAADRKRLVQALVTAIRVDPAARILAATIVAA